MVILDNLSIVPRSAYGAAGTVPDLLNSVKDDIDEKIIEKLEEYYEKLAEGLEDLLDFDPLEQLQEYFISKVPSVQPIENFVRHKGALDSLESAKINAEREMMGLPPIGSLVNYTSCCISNITKIFYSKTCQWLE